MPEELTDIGTPPVAEIGPSESLARGRRAAGRSYAPAVHGGAPLSALWGNHGHELALLLHDWNLARGGGPSAIGSEAKLASGKSLADAGSV